MATHEQTHLGQVFDSMQDDGLIVFDESENSYGLAAEFVQRATALGVVIDAEPACSDCNGDHPDHIHENDPDNPGTCVHCWRHIGGVLAGHPHGRNSIGPGWRVKASPLFQGYTSGHR